jgi:hypothetical protein
MQRVTYMMRMDLPDDLDADEAGKALQLDLRDYLAAHDVDVNVRIETAFIDDED